MMMTIVGMRNKRKK